MHNAENSLVLSMSKVTIDPPGTHLAINEELTEFSLDLGLTLWIITEVLGRGVIAIPINIELTVIMHRVITLMNAFMVSHRTYHLGIADAKLVVILIRCSHLMLSPCTSRGRNMDALEFHHRRGAGAAVIAVVDHGIGHGEGHHRVHVVIATGSLEAISRRNCCIVEA